MEQRISTLPPHSPKTLYEECLTYYVGKLNYKVSTLNSVNQLCFLPPEVLIDIFVLMSDNENLTDMLLEQLLDLCVFEKLLRFSPAHEKLLYCLKSLSSNNKPIATQLQENFTMRHQNECKAYRCSLALKGCIRPSAALTAMTKATVAEHAINPDYRLPCTTEKNIPTLPEIKLNINILETKTEIEAKNENANASDDNLEQDNNIHNQLFGYGAIDFGLLLGSFLTEAGWISQSIKVLECVATELRELKQTNSTRIVRLDCLQRLLHAQSLLCSFKAAEYTFDEIVELLDVINIDSIPKALKANTFTQFSTMYFARSEYDNSHMWSVVAMCQLEDTSPPRTVVDTLRQAAKSCVVMRDFQRANLLICNATERARQHFGEHHQKYADALLDYGFFLLNVDSVYHSVKIYTQSLSIKRNIFGSRNFYVAIAHEDLAYAYYVHEYSTGNFTFARDHVEKAVDIMKDHVPSDHLMLASAKRVKALLLEEIALTKMSEGSDEEGMLRQSEELHKFALQLSLEVFGEINVQTAKHYGNLGRLYQSMNRLEEAERMHEKAISIKTALLGPYDYEVGLSIGHLASLYNYQMKKYREAEKLYLRSIDISLRLFGRTYTGLEYDYLGLCHVYEVMGEFEKYLKYANILERWQVMRDQHIAMNKTSFPSLSELCSLEQVKLKFFTMSTQVPSNSLSVEV